MSTNYPTIAISDEALISFTPPRHATVHLNSQMQVVLAILRPPFVSSLLQIYSSRVRFRPATKELQGIWHRQQQTLRRRPPRRGISPYRFASSLSIVDWPQNLTLSSLAHRFSTSPPLIPRSETRNRRRYTLCLQRSWVPLPQEPPHRAFNPIQRLLPFKTILWAPSRAERVASMDDTKGE